MTAMLQSDVYPRREFGRAELSIVRDSDVSTIGALTRAVEYAPRHAAAEIVAPPVRRRPRPGPGHGHAIDPPTGHPQIIGWARLALGA